MDNSQDKNIKDILEIVTLVKDNAITKEYFEENAITKEYFEENAVTKEFFKENAVTKEYLEEKLSETKNELMNHIDTFIGLHQKLDIEITSLRSKYDRLETSMKKVLEHLHLEA